MARALGAYRVEVFEGHTPEHWVDDVCQLPLLALRVAPGEFFDQIERALTAGGWSSIRASAAS
ncbi:hypothetical protein [Nocardioides sp. InS609-2]|uniref:hypothetical protein n=1 Tax=Nocardioides sp. InS609-2 TaxID=2760705 RepID=UPI0020BFBE2A|nr:hypothetical protein [Nocardioides sp. InS609-2]